MFQPRNDRERERARIRRSQGRKVSNLNNKICRETEENYKDTEAKHQIIKGLGKGIIRLNCKKNDDLQKLISIQTRLSNVRAGRRFVSNPRNNCLSGGRTPDVAHKEIVSQYTKNIGECRDFKEKIETRPSAIAAKERKEKEKKQVFKEKAKQKQQKKLQDPEKLAAFKKKKKEKKKAAAKRKAAKAAAAKAAAT